MTPATAGRPPGGMDDPGERTDVNKPICSTVGCVKPTRTRNMCQSCYDRQRSAGRLQLLLPLTERHELSQVDTAEATAVCSICGPTRIRVRTGSRGHECLTIRKRHQKASTRRTTTWSTRIRDKYGMTEADWAARLIEQSGLCAICLNPLTEPHVDHDHATGAVRGLLCRYCNFGLGNFRDSTTALQAACRYLKETSSDSA